MADTSDSEDENASSIIESPRAKTPSLKDEVAHSPEDDFKED
jgi:hypothetical protein